MPRARNKKDRVLQLGRCLCKTFPTPYPVSIRVARKIAADRKDEKQIRRTGYHGETWRDGRKIFIRIAVRKEIRGHDAVDTLIHEFAHAVSMRHDKIEGKRLDHGAHDDEWALAHGKIYRWFYDQKGDEESWNF